jgi:hypothetical protein
MPQSPDLARAALKIEELPTDDGSVLDAIAGAILRIFVRINQIEKVHDRIMHRLAALERELERRLRRIGSGATTGRLRPADGRGGATHARSDRALRAFYRKPA